VEGEDRGFPIVLGTYYLPQIPMARRAVADILNSFIASGYVGMDRTGIVSEIADDSGVDSDKGVWRYLSAETF
jgi:hypothetical protein